MGWAFNHAHRFDQAIEQCQKTLDMDPNFFFLHWCLGFAYLHKGMYKEAIAALQKAVGLTKDDLVLLSDLGIAYGMSGQRDQAQRVLDTLKEKAKQGYVPPLAFAWFYAGLGEKNQAFEWLQKAYEERSSWLIFLKVHPRYDNLRSDPRFIALLKRMGLEK